MILLKPILKSTQEKEHQKHRETLKNDVEGSAKDLHVILHKTVVLGRKDFCESGPKWENHGLENELKESVVCLWRPDEWEVIVLQCITGESNL